MPSQKTMTLVNVALALLLAALILTGCLHMHDTKFIHHGKKDGGSVLWNPHEQHTVSDSDGS